MSTVQQTVTVDQNTLTVGLALAKAIADGKAALKENAGGLAETVQLMSVALNDILPILATIPQVPAETKDPNEVMTLAIIGQAIYQAIVS